MYNICFANFRRGGSARPARPLLNPPLIRDTITTTLRWYINVVKTIITLIEILHHTLTILWYQEDESILNKKKLLQCQSLHFLYIFWWGMNMMYKMQLIFFGLLKLFLPWNFNCLFTSRSDNYFVISGHILQGKFLFLLKYKSTVSHSPIEWAYYASGIEKPDLCCYCAAKGIQQDNDLRKKYWVVLPLCQACLRDKKPILKRNPIKNWQNMSLMLHNCF